MLTGRVAVVTGGASGIGRAVAKRLVSDGATVVITDIRADAGPAIAEELGATFVAHDVRDEKDWERVIKTIAADVGALQILVNSAGVIGLRESKTPEDTSLSDWQRIFAINVEGTFLGCRAAIAAMRVSGSGTIVNLSSVAGLIPTPWAVAYGASKAAVRHITTSVAEYCAQQKLNVRCNSVHPGIVLTPLLQNAWTEDARLRGVSYEQIVEDATASVPMGDLTRPEDVAASVAFLVSDEARHITGAKIVVDGGILYGGWGPPSQVRSP
jgi:3(or 17)beta-hydroxysteroid dehydrogenase